FSGPLVEVMAHKIDRDPPPPDGALAPLCMHLLARDPATRAGAAELLALEGRPQDAAPRDLYVGRQRELAALLERLPARGKPTVALVTGPSGIGKSRLLRHFAEEAQRRLPAALVLQARCFEREDVPFKALDGLIDGLARALRNQPDVEAILPRDVAALT